MYCGPTRKGRDFSSYLVCYCLHSFYCSFHQLETNKTPLFQVLKLYIYLSVNPLSWFCWRDMRLCFCFVKLGFYLQGLLIWPLRGTIWLVEMTFWVARLRWNLFCMIFYNCWHWYQGIMQFSFLPVLNLTLWKKLILRQVLS